MNVPLTPIRFKRRAANLYGRKIGVVCGSERFTYQQFSKRANQLSHALSALGVKRGDRVAFLSCNCHRLLEAYYGIVQAGAVLMPLNIRFSPQEMSFILNDSEAGVLFLEPDFLAVVDLIRKEVKTVKRYVLLEGDAKPAWAEPLSYEELLADQPTDEPDLSALDENGLAEIFYTSGTTGEPKGVMLSHRNLYLHAMNVLASVPFADTDVQLHTIPLFHVNGWGTPHIVTGTGGTHVMLKRFDPKAVLDLIEKERVTSFLLVPTMAHALIHTPDFDQYDVRSVRRIIIGGAASTPELIKAVEERFGCECYAGYGLSETSPVLALAFLKGHIKQLPPEERYKRQAMTG